MPRVDGATRQRLDMADLLIRLAREGVSMEIRVSPGHLDALGRPLPSVIVQAGDRPPLVIDVAAAETIARRMIRQGRFNQAAEFRAVAASL